LKSPYGLKDYGPPQSDLAAKEQGVFPAAPMGQENNLL
jgi:hypothetical protein